MKGGHRVDDVTDEILACATGPIRQYSPYSKHSNESRCSMSVSRLCLVLADLAVVAGLIASQPAVSSLSDDSQMVDGQTSVIRAAPPDDPGGQGWFLRPSTA